MEQEPNFSLKRAQRTGVWICLAAVLGAVLFLSGLAQGSYWALAVPVGVGVLSALALAFWIGYTINTVKGIPPEAEHYQDARARSMAKGVCAGSVVLAVLYMVGISHQSYWALALPVGLAVLGLLAMVFWIGWAILMQRTTLTEAREEPARDAPVGGYPADEPACDDGASAPGNGASPPARDGD